jgi:DNA-binding NarL/FixJ family response regulator
MHAAASCTLEFYTVANLPNQLTTYGKHGMSNLSIFLLRSSHLVKYVPEEILIADDNDITRGALRSYLVRNNLAVCGEAIDGKDAVEKALKLNPALILLDLWMPQMNGIEVACVLRPRMPDLRIVLVTMFADAQMLESLKSKAGIDVVISKPEGLERLAERIRRLLALGGRKQSYAQYFS